MIPRPKLGLSYLAMVVITLGVYVIPQAVPLKIGTAYILLSCLLSVLGLYIWASKTASPKHILILGVLLILILLPLPALTSNDIDRYLWDGAVFLNGHDPYVTAPNDEKVSALRQLWSTPEEHAAYATLYPPGALSLFAMSALGGPVYGVWVWKIIASTAAVVALIVSYRLLKHRGGLEHFALIALSPLFFLETGVGAHLDIICVLGVVSALWCLEKDKIVLAGIIIGLAASVKFLPAVMAGPLLFYLKPRQAVKLFLSAASIWGLIYLVMFGLGYKPLGLLPVFFEKWRGGAPLYPLLEAIQILLSLSKTQFLALLGLLAVLTFGLSAWIAKKGHIILAIALTFSVPLLLSPVLFPWYLMIFLPLLALRPNATLILVLTLAPFSYVVLDRWLSQGLWEPASWPAMLLLFAILMGLFIDSRSHRRKPAL